MRQLFNASPKIRGSSPKIFYPAKFFVDFTQLPTLIANISGTRQDIKNRKDMWSRVIPPSFVERIPVNFGPLSTKYYMWVWTHPSRLISTDYISALRGCWLLKFLHTLEFDEGLLAHTTNRVRGLPKKFKGEHLKLGLKFHTCAPITLGVVGVTSRNFTRWRGSRQEWSNGH